MQEGGRPGGLCSSGDVHLPNQLYCSYPFWGCQDGVDLGCSRSGGLGHGCGVIFVGLIVVRRASGLSGIAYGVPRGHLSIALDTHSGLRAFTFGGALVLIYHRGFPYLHQIQLL